MRDSEPGRAGTAVQPSAWHTSAIRRRKFNTEDPVIATDHYCIPPLERVNLDRIL